MAKGKNQTNWQLLASIFIFLVLIIVALLAGFTKQTEVTSANAGSMLALIAAAAVGIERVIEVLWTLIDRSKVAWWPLNLAGDITKLIDELDDQMEPLYDRAKVVTDKLGKAAGNTKTAIAKAETTLEKLKAEISSQKNAPLNDRTRQISLSVTSAIAYVEQITNEANVKANVQFANQALARLTDFVGSFRDNPGRRLVSILIGAVFGLAIAGFAGFDIFAAVRAEPVVTAAAAKLAGQASQNGGNPFHWGIVVTGLIMGLGANPTHEVISTLREVKKQRRSQNQPEPQIRSVAPIQTTPLTPMGKGFFPIISSTTMSASSPPPVRRYR
jgi:hypothetical protein